MIMQRARIIVGYARIDPGTYKHGLTARQKGWLEAYNGEGGRLSPLLSTVYVRFM